MKQEHVLGFVIGLFLKDAIGPVIRVSLNWISKLWSGHRPHDPHAVETRLKIAAEQIDEVRKDLGAVTELGDHGYPICPGCGQEIDPDICGCGDVIDHYEDSHRGIPMGCDCYRVKTKPHPLNVDGGST